MFVRGASHNQGRIYRLSLCAQPTPESLWSQLDGSASANEQSDEALSRRLRKAQRGRYGQILLCESSLRSDKYMAQTRFMTQQNFSLIQQISCSQLQRVLVHFLQHFKDNNIELNILLDMKDVDTRAFDELMDRGVRLRFTVPGLKSNPFLSEIKRWPGRFHQATDFYVPYDLEQHPKEIFTASQVVRLQESIDDLAYDNLWKPVSGLDVYESRLSESADLEPLLDPIFHWNKTAAPKISVIIPCYNSESVLKSTLDHLNAQKIDSSLYEVIVVDDGSSDHTSEKITEWAEGYQMDLSYIYYPRLAQRKMGDSQFRAGLARNLGVTCARGELLSFLDSDILVPKNYLERVLEQLHQHDLVLWRREHLKAPLTYHQTYEDLRSSQDNYEPETEYWHQFYKDAASKGWSSLPDYWKYTCTYGLSLSKELFERRGWFRKTFCFYGFEDTDLGWRMHASGDKFYFHNEPLFHQYQETIRSEFGQSLGHRHLLLKKTARIFFYNNLAPEIYQVFKGYLKQGFFS